MFKVNDCINKEINSNNKEKIPSANINFYQLIFISLLLLPLFDKRKNPTSRGKDLRKFAKFFV